MTKAFNGNELCPPNKSCRFFSCRKRQERIFRTVNDERRRTQLPYGLCPVPAGKQCYQLPTRRNGIVSDTRRTFYRILQLFRGRPVFRS